MEQAEETRAEAGRNAAGGRAWRRGRWVLLGVVVVLVVVALVVPWINVNRFQRRIVSSLSESLGRPIHLDRISLTVLPLPGLTIENLVVAEDPAFGAEPFVRASTVTARLRVGSLWRRRVEFSRISFTDPSINLVKTRGGKWNIESILLQAARIEAAPTAQVGAGDAPRFPYIEATGARLNLKLDAEKTPYSLTEAEFALSLRSPREWQLRLNGRPLRTDMSAAEIGLVRLEGTLGRASALAEVPVDLRAEWRRAPLGETSRVVLGRDAGLRGTMTVVATLRGTLGRGAVESTLHLAELRRADFVPERPLNVDAECLANEVGMFGGVEEVRCSWPPAASPGTGTVALTGSVPDTRRMAGASFDVGTPGVPAATLLEWVRVGSSRVPGELTAAGTLTGSLALRPAAGGLVWSGQMGLAEGSVRLPSVSPEPVFTGRAVVRSVVPGRFVLAPVELDLGDRDFATLSGEMDGAGYTLHLRGTALPAKLRALGVALPQLGDGLAEVLPKVDGGERLRFDLVGTRGWGGGQSWVRGRR